MDCCDYIIGFSVLGIVLLPVILQGVGTYGSDWIKDVTCLSINPKPLCCDWTGRNSSWCESSFHLTELDAAAYNIEAASFGILILPIICFFLEVFCNKDEETGCWGVLGGFAFLLYPIAGLLSFVGCMIVVGKYSGLRPGSSFYYCLGCGLYVMVMTGISICIICKNKKHKRSSAPPSSAMQAYAEQGAAAPYGGGPPAVSAQSITYEERVAVHDPETGGFMVFMRSIKFSILPPITMQLMNNICFNHNFKFK